MKLLTVRIEDDLQAAFLAAAQSQDQTGSQLIRRWVREYVAQHGQARLFDQPKKKVERHG